MAHPDPAFAYAQSRVQARYGGRPVAADWAHLAATADLGALVQVMRGSPLARWSQRVAPGQGVHGIERALREEWLRDVDEVADWQPAQWRDAVRWLRWLPWLPALQKIARGGRALGWMREDPVLGPIVARDPRERVAALRSGGLAPLAQGFAAPQDMAAAWSAHWRALWPGARAQHAGLETLLRIAADERRRLERQESTVRSTATMASLERRLERSFRRNPLSPVASVAYLWLLALDLTRMRGALARRALVAAGAGA